MTTPTPLAQVRLIGPPTDSRSSFLRGVAAATAVVAANLFKELAALAAKGVE